MKIETKIYIISILSIVFIALQSYIYNENKQHKIEIENFKNFSDKASKLIVLQNLWDNKKHDKKLVEKIKKRFNPIRYSIKGNLGKFLFKNLSNTEFTSLGKIILNSNLIIKKFDLKRENSKISLELEFKL